MCWSTEVTLAFVLLELGCCAIIAAQGLHGLLLAYGPLVLQEVVQLLLWLEIDRHDPAVGGGTCSAVNTALSFVELLLVCGLVPVGFALLAMRSLGEWQAALAAALHADTLQLLATEDTEAVAREERRLSGSIRSLRRQRRRLWLLVGVSGAVALFECGYAGWGWHAGWWSPFCTVAGPMGGHQLWPWMQPRLPSSSAHAAGGEGRAVPSELATPSELALRVAVWFLYLLLVGVGVVSFRGETLPESPPLPACRRGRLPLLLLTVLTPSFLPHLWWRWGAEFGSIWCWGASAAMLATLAEPRIARWAHRCHRSSLSAHKHRSLREAPDGGMGGGIGGGIGGGMGGGMGGDAQGLCEGNCRDNQGRCHNWAALVGALVWRDLMMAPVDAIELQMRERQVSASSAMSCRGAAQVRIPFNDLELS